MPDVFTKAKRSLVMSRVRAHGNKNTELMLVKLFWRNGITGWRRSQKIFGKPDFVFRQQRLALFVDGCFWHGCPKHESRPVTHRAFWENKFTRNKTRDRLVNRTLRKRGWSILRIWQHELKRRNEPRLLRRIRRALG